MPMTACGALPLPSTRNAELSLLVGGNKSGVSKDRFYRDLIRVADFGSISTERHRWEKEKRCQFT